MSSQEVKMEKPQIEKPIPVITTESRPFWDGCRDGRLMLQQCGDCGGWIYYPRALCTHCHSDNLEWKQASGEGVIYSYTVCRRPAGPAFKEEVPYVVALIDLKEGPRMLSNVIGCAPEAVRIGQDVRVRFEALNDEVTLPKFELAG